MTYPLIRDLAADGIPVAVTCRVLNIVRQPYWRWLECPVPESELLEVYRANPLFDAHHEDPEFGYRLLADEAAHEHGKTMADRPAWRISREADRDKEPLNDLLQSVTATSCSTWLRGRGGRRPRSARSGGPTIPSVT